MVKISINFNEVARAATALQEQGQAVTIDTVRTFLGTGSNVTLGIYLKQWREQQPNNGTALPDKFGSLVQDLYQYMQDEARQRVIEAVSVVKAELESVKVSLAHLLHQNEELVKERVMLHAELEVLQENTESVQAQNDILESQNLNLKTDIQAHIQVIEASTVNLSREREVHQNVLLEQQQCIKTLEDKIIWAENHFEEYRNTMTQQYTEEKMNHEQDCLQLKQTVLEIQTMRQDELALSLAMTEKLERLQLDKKALEATLEGIKNEFSHMAWS